MMGFDSSKKNMLYPPHMFQVIMIDSPVNIFALEVLIGSTYIGIATI